MTTTCSNCGQTLTEQNIALAVAESTLTYEELSFCCPSYHDDTGCAGYSRADQETAAYWATK